MPKGNPKPQTVATGKYEKKVGLISKSYKLKREVVEAFSEACEIRGTSQAAELTKFMRQFIEETKQLQK